MISLTFDVEPDLHTQNYEGIEKGLKLIVTILNKNKIKATFFVTCDCIEKHPNIFQKLKGQGHEIALHGYRHERYDELPYKEKEMQIKKSILCFKKYLKIKPEGFRAPQCSIDNKTLDLLEKYNFIYDSSYSPLNLLQLLFFPSKFNLWLKHFFSPRKKYKIRTSLYEIPLSSFFVPFVSLIFRIFPEKLLRFYFDNLKILTRDIILSFHSWDFIDLPESRIARVWGKEKLIENLDSFLKYTVKKDKFGRIITLIR